MGDQDRRHEVRVLLKVPLVIEGVDIYGKPYREETVTEDVSVHGACIRTTNKLASQGSQLKISAVEFDFKAVAVVQILWLDDVDGVLKMGVEFTDSEDNWILK